jgi:hypothetical protein
MSPINRQQAHLGIGLLVGLLFCPLAAGGPHSVTSGGRSDDDSNWEGRLDEIARALTQELSQALNASACKMAFLQCCPGGQIGRREFY